MIFFWVNSSRSKFIVLNLCSRCVYLAQLRHTFLFVMRRKVTLMQQQTLDTFFNLITTFPILLLLSNLLLTSTAHCYYVPSLILIQPLSYAHSHILIITIIIIFIIICHTTHQKKVKQKIQSNKTSLHNITLRTIVFHKRREKLIEISQIILLDCMS